MNAETLKLIGGFAVLGTISLVLLRTPADRLIDRSPWWKADVDNTMPDGDD